VRLQPIWRLFILCTGVLLSPGIGNTQPCENGPLQPRGGDQSVVVEASRVVDLPPAGGGSQRVLYAAARPSRGTIVMLPGGAGEVDIETGGDFLSGKNFVVRARELWNANGYTVVITDAFNNTNMRGIRSSPQYAAAVGEVVEYARKQTPGSVFLLGTSQGSIAAMNGAAHLRKARSPGLC
jgi:hypothetical protein